MAEQIIDIRERIEKMRIKFEDDDKSDFNNASNDENNVAYEEKKEINNLPNEETANHQKQDIKFNENNNLRKFFLAPGSIFRHGFDRSHQERLQ